MQLTINDGQVKAKSMLFVNKIIHGMVTHLNTIYELLTMKDGKSSER